LGKEPSQIAFERLRKVPQGNDRLIASPIGEAEARGAVEALRDYRATEFELAERFETAMGTANERASFCEV
jgi:hypothetical protein